MVPEEKLLRLIRGKKLQKSLEEKKQGTGKVLSSGNDLFNATISRILVFLSFRSGIRIIQAVCVLAFVFMLINFLYPVFFLKNIPVFSQIKEAQGLIAGNSVPGISFETYSRGLSGRSIFKASGAGEVLPLVPGTGIDLDFSKDFTLVAIIAGDAPQAVIEDKKAQKTYYLNKGQFIGDAKIEDIQEGKITVSYRGKLYELRM